MQAFVGLLDGSADNWGVRVPDAPGCYGGGPTPEDAIASATEALQDLLSDEEYLKANALQPTPIETLRDEPAIRAALAAGDVLVLLPVPGDERDHAPIAAE